MEKMILEKISCFVVLFSIALICEANKIAKDKLETSNSTDTEKEDKAITLLEEALSLLKEQKVQIGKTIFISSN